MDGGLAIEHNRDALKRIVVALVAMADFSVGSTLPRRLHRFILQLARPAEAAARRLVIALARGIAVTLPAVRRRGREPAIPGFGKMTSMALPWTVAAAVPPRPPVLPLLDSLRQPPLRQWVRLSALPRICVPGITDRRPIPARLALSQDDQLDATGLSRRLQALSLALDDLPRQAMRFARWQARRRSRPDSHRARRRWPLRLGRPPGWRRKRRAHEVFDVLDHANQLAHFALEHPDTS